MQEQPQGTTSEAESSLPLSHCYYEWLSGHNISLSARTVDVVGDVMSTGRAKQVRHSRETDGPRLEPATYTEVHRTPRSTVKHRDRCGVQSPPPRATYLMHVRSVIISGGSLGVTDLIGRSGLMVKEITLTLSPSHQHNLRKRAPCTREPQASSPILRDLGTRPTAYQNHPP
ncbi:unnamed protein product [Boreogadus saida]